MYIDRCMNICIGIKKKFSLCFIRNPSLSFLCVLKGIVPYRVRRPKNESLGRFHYLNHVPERFLSLLLGCFTLKKFVSDLSACKGVGAI